MEILQKVTELKAELDSYRPLDKDQEAAIMQKLRLDWNFHSNHLEGNSLTYGETRALIMSGITASGKPLKDHFEITGHNKAILWVEEIVRNERPLTENFIRQIHTLILKESYESYAETYDGKPLKKKINIGSYKSTPNHVRTVTGEIFRFATPEETPAKMNDLVNWYRNEKNNSEAHPLLLAAEFHYKFIRIHPFDDGNGRTARIIMNFILMQNGYPPVIVKTEEKNDYIAALRQADAGVITPFVEYIGKNLLYSLDLMIKGAQGVDVMDLGDVDKEIALLKHELKNFDNRTPIKNSSEVKLKLFKVSISPLFEKFISKCSEFDEYYDQVKIVYYLDGSGMVCAKDEVVQKIEGELSDPKKNRNEISLRYEYEGFKKEGFDFFNRNSIIKVHFRDYEYKTSISNDDFKISKPNYSNLTEHEIQKIILLEIKKHTEYINLQIKNAKTKNN